MRDVKRPDDRAAAVRNSHGWTATTSSWRARALGPEDGYLPEGAARAYLRDLPDAELHLLDGGH